MSLTEINFYRVMIEMKRHIAFFGSFLILIGLCSCAQINTATQSKSTKRQVSNNTCSLNQNLPSNKFDSLSREQLSNSSQSIFNWKPLSDLDLHRELDQELIKIPPHSQEKKSSKVSTQKEKKSDQQGNIDFELDIRETQVFQDYFYYYGHKHHQTFQRWLKRAEPYLPYIRKVFQQKGLPLDLVFLPLAESGFDPWAYSRAGAAGLWQFIPGTARTYGLEVNWWIDERRDPYKSTQAAGKYLQKLYAQFQDWYLVLAAYNCGEGRIERALARTGQEDYFDLIRTRSCLNRETRNYVPKFLAILKIIRNLKELNFSPIKWQASAQPTTIKIPAGTDLLALSKAMGLGWSEFRDKNPAFRRTFSPPNGERTVYLSRHLLSKAKTYLSQKKSRICPGYRRYKIQTGDSWWNLSRKFDVPIKVLKKTNRISSNLLRPGQWVFIPAPHRATGPNSNNYASATSTYTVQRGDTLWGIAQSFQLSIKELKRANHLHSNSIHIGQKLDIPSSSNLSKTRELAQKRANYLIKQGDTLWSLSQRFGVSINTLVQANGLTNEHNLTAGEKLYIPDLTYRQTRIARQKAKGGHQRIIHYQVNKGDSLWDISQKFQVGLNQLMSWNNLSEKDLLHPGDKIKIYVR